MEAPPSAPPLSAPAPHLNYPDSVGSSPRSRNNDSLDDSLTPAVSGGGAKLRLMCSYGGHIIPRPHDKSLCYVGGDTRIMVADRNTNLSDLTNRLSKTLLNGQSFTLKYQLPNEDLDSLISVTTDEDLENMIEEFDRLTTAAQKSSRLRLFLFSSKPESASSFGSLLENSTKSEDWFLDALNGANRGLSDSVSVNCLLGLDNDVAITGNVNSKDVESQIESFANAKGVSGNNNKQGFQDVHSVPDSPMLETTSSFGSTSSSPSLANLPPIRVHVEDHRVMMGGIEEQFSQMSVGAAVQKQDDGGFVVLSSPPTALTAVPVATAVSGVPVGSAGVAGEYSNRLISDDERSEQRMSVGYRKPPQPQQQPQPQLKQSGGLDLASPDSVSSDGSITNPLSRQRPMIYQDPGGNNRVSVKPVDSSDPNSKVHMQQVQDSGYVLPTQFDHQHQQLNPQQQQHQQLNPQQQHQQLNPQQQHQQLNPQQQHQQLNPQQQHQQLNPQQQQHQQLNPQQQQQQPFIQANTHYIQHHSTGVPSYYPIYPSHQQNPQLQALDQQYPVYYMPARSAQAYNLSVQQSNYSEAAPSNRPQTPPPSAMIPNSATYNPARTAVGAAKPEMVAGLYRTAASSAQPFMQVPSNQHQQQYMGFSQIHHPSQSIAPTSAASANYAYEFADPTHAQVYYSRALASQLAAQHQTMTSDAQLPTDNIKQQIRTSQP